MTECAGPPYGSTEAIGLSNFRAREICWKVGRVEPNTENQIFVFVFQAIKREATDQANAYGLNL